MLVNTGKIGGAISAASKPTAISDLKTAASSNNSTAIFNTSALGGGTGYSTTDFDRKYVIPAFGAIVTAVGIYSGGASLLSLLSTLPQGGAALAFAGGGELALSVEGVLQAAIKTAATITATVSATKVGKVLYDSGTDKWGDEYATREPVGKQKGQAPRNNQAQNRQVQEIKERLGLDKNEARALHDEIKDRGYGFKEILEIAKDMFGK